MAPARALLVALLIALSLQQTSWTAQGSWAVGVVVPQGAALMGGERLAWENITNVTAVVTLPDIGHTDGTIYAVLSLMITNGDIMQVAAGLYPNSTKWMVYPMIFSTSGQSYTPIHVLRNQNMSPGDTVIMSIEALNGSWTSEVRDLNTSEASECSFGLPSSLKLMSGPQYVLALESYTSNESVFRSMGTMEMDGLLFNGVPLEGGEYVYSTWNGETLPLFIVGGASPPDFIYCYASGGRAYWEYVQGWKPSGTQAGPGIVYAVILAAALLNAAALVIIMALRRRRGSEG